MARLTLAPDAVTSDHFYITSNSVVVELNGTDPAVIEAIKGTKKIGDSGMIQVDMDSSRDLIGSAVAGVNSTGFTGEGVKVGVIDSGIIASLIPGLQPFFDCKTAEFGGYYFSGMTGIPAIGIKNENGNILAPGAAYVNPHGTHVAGTIGGCQYTISDGSVWDGTASSGAVPGVEPRDYNVSPGIGAGYVASGGSAFSHDIANAIEDAVADGMDIINMSLGGGVQGPHDFLQEVANSAVDAGVVVVTSTGNEGPGFFTVGSPGTGDKVIATAASTNSRGTGVEIVTPPGGNTYYAMPAQFPDFNGSSYDLIDWPGTDNLAFSAVGAGALSGEVVLIARGDCAFSQKVENAELAGAGGVIVYNHSGAPIVMARTDSYDDELPAVMVSTDDGLALEVEANATATTATISPPTTTSTTPNLLVDFSSWGPAAFTYNVKPDAMALASTSCRAPGSDSSCTTAGR